MLEGQSQARFFLNFCLFGPLVPAKDPPGGFSAPSRSSQVQGNKPCGHSPDPLTLLRRGSGSGMKEWHVPQADLNQ